LDDALTQCRRLKIMIVPYAILVKLPAIIRIQAWYRGLRLR